jgi:hypothetical protein
MFNQVAVLDTNNFDSLAKAMGMSVEDASNKTQTLPRLRISHSSIMGDTEVKGKKVKMEVVPAGMYRFEVPEGPTYYAPSISLRPFAQRFMYKRFIKGDGNNPNRFVKTVMSDNLNKDLKDNAGGFNCGKPSGWVKDFKALPASTQDLIRQIKRTRVVFGSVLLNDVLDENGDPVDNVNHQACIWEIENRTAYKEIGDVFSSFSRKKRLPIQHSVELSTTAVQLPNGNSYYVPVSSVDMDTSHSITKEDQDTFSMFMDWIDGYNRYILKAWAEKNSQDDSYDDADTALAGEISNVFSEDTDEVSF